DISQCNRHVRFTPESGHVRCNSRCPLWADTVEKVVSDPPKRNNQIRTARYLNRNCVRGRDFESMLRIQGRKIVFQQYRPKADSCTAAINVISSAAPSQRSRHIALRTGGAFLLLQTECEPNWQ